MKQFNLLKGQEERDVALQRLYLSPTNQQWIVEAKRALWYVICHFETFTTDDVWATGLRPAPGDSRALGPVMMAAKNAKHIVATKGFRATVIVSNHAAPKRIWRSRMFNLMPGRPHEQEH